ncbi:hypothetical protein KP509_23G077100 [Ceratopteris richardii]|uniref:XS domain-containing protein n=1 Tax=Ceratopteris richardii TaxID=49495 RepID=A0A8T2S391_CERRI|nr:hypothetical protein KP509_23G077100 [Ceratopteris richardii]
MEARPQENVHTSMDVEVVQNKETETISFFNWKEGGDYRQAADSCSDTLTVWKLDESWWGDLNQSLSEAPAPHEQAPSSAFDHLSTGTDSECSDVDLDNDWVTSGSSDSDATIESLQSRKQNKWLCSFFRVLNNISESERENTLFYCPACRGSGLGETDLYKGLKPLKTHAKNYTKRRVKLHKEFASILKEELKTLGEMPKSEANMGRIFQLPWQLAEGDLTDPDPLILWPPMVVIRTACLKSDTHEKSLTIDAKCFLEVFKQYCPRRVRHAYDPAGQLSLLSLLLFLDSPAGYVHAKHLVKDFKHSERGRKQWNEHARIEMESCFCGTQYAYMATEEDVVLFNRCDQSKKKIAWIMKSYSEVVVQPLVEMDDAKLKNSLLRVQIKEKEEHNRILEEILRKLDKGMGLTGEETRVVQDIASRP